MLQKERGNEDPGFRVNDTKWFSSHIEVLLAECLRVCITWFRLLGDLLCAAYAAKLFLVKVEDLVADHGHINFLILLGRVADLIAELLLLVA